MANTSLPVNWSLIRSAVETGTPYDKVAAKFGVKASTIRTKACRGGWITPQDIKELAKTVDIDKDGNVAAKVAEEPRATLKSQKQEVLQLVEQSWAEKGESYRRMMAHKLEPLLKNAKLEPPKNWKDMEIAAKIATRTLGLDTGETQVNVALVNQVAGFGGARDPDLSWLKGDSFEPAEFAESKESPAAIEADGE